MNSPVREGEILAGKYRVDRVLGAGGMGVVVAAHHLELDETFAIKFLLPGTLKSADAIARFAREARAAAKIKNEHVVRVSDVGTLENGAPYMVMEYLEGSDLATVVAERGPLPIPQAVDIVLEACEAIAEAHSLGIIHRDLKPANLFIAQRSGGKRCVKVLDFGISKSSGLGGSGAMTRTSDLMGSPLYMSPEQMQSSKDVDARSDIWALGAILYELVTGATPFIADTIPELVVRVLQSPPPPIRSVVPQAPEAFEAILLKCLNKDRKDRYASVAELVAALAPFAAGAKPLPQTSRAEPPVTITAPLSSRSTDGGTMASWGRTGTNRGRGMFVLVAATGLLLSIGVAALLLRQTPDRATQTASAAAPVSPTARSPVSPTAVAPTPSRATAAAALAASGSPAVAASGGAPPVHEGSSGGTASKGPSAFSSAEPSARPSASKGPAPKIVTMKPRKAAKSSSPPAAPARPSAVPTLSPPPRPKPSQPTDQWGDGRL